MSNYFKQINYKEEDKMTDYDAEQSIDYMTKYGLGFVCEQNDEGPEFHHMSEIGIGYEYKKNKQNWISRNCEHISRYLNNYHEQLCVHRAYKYTITIEIDSIHVLTTLNKDDIYNYFTDNEEDFNNSNMRKIIFIKFKLIKEGEYDIYKDNII